MNKDKPPKKFSDQNIAREYLLEYARKIREAKLISETNPVKRRRLSSFFPWSPRDLQLLERLVLSWCSKLDWSSLPWGNMRSLKQLYAGGTAINQAPFSMGAKNLLGSTFWSLPPNPRDGSISLRFSLASLSRSLQILSLVDCKITDDAIPYDLDNLFMLQELILNENQISSLPKGIKYLPRLRSLQMERCEKLQFLPETLNSLSVNECISLEVITNLPNLLTSLNFLGFHCGKLKVVEELFQLKPIGSFDSNLTNMFSLIDTEILNKVHVNLYNFLTLTRRIETIQGLYEFGVFSTSLPKTGMPPWFAYRSIENPIRLSVPSVPDLHIHSLNICIIYKNSDISTIKNKERFWNEYRITINNETKDVKWTNSPVIMGIPYHDAGITWLSHWEIGQYLDRGDKVKISVALMYELQLEKFGVQIVYEDDEEDTRQVSAYQSQHHLINGVDISAFQVARGSYFLCHHDFYIYQDNSKNDGWHTNGWLDFLFSDSEEDTNTDAKTKR
ncbi:hypothetical protein HAX54_037503 [Datura stramonium]|uniref:Disease resistance protein RPS4B/Roq1-like leucine-rich repeats domain-containing protein n=1 Tax=Datura stramonium TaxID=4076 RepID=A0ABS8SI19_DATST|nr:hypothetical protein [Datura stramonium]